MFYGPKIDLKVKDSIGREWQLGTVQFDFNQPASAASTPDDLEDFWKLKTFQQIFKTKEKLAKYLDKLGRGFNVTYVDSNGQEKQCVMIHRVVFGSMERFFGILIEHFGGAFPLWLAPTQVKVVPIAQRHVVVGRKFLQQLQEAGVRAEIDDRNERMQAKIRDATLQKIPYMAIIGDKEIENQEISVRSRDNKISGSLTVARFLGKLKEEIETKR